MSSRQYSPRLVRNFPSLDFYCFSTSTSHIQQDGLRKDSTVTVDELDDLIDKPKFPATSPPATSSESQEDLQRFPFPPSGGILHE
jgi:hypothetical protein